MCLPPLKAGFIVCVHRSSTWAATPHSAPWRCHCGCAPALRPRCWLGLLRVCVCVCVCVCVWQKTRRLAPGPATQPLHPEHTLSVFSGSRFPCWELSQLGAQGHTPKGSWKKMSQHCSGHTLNEGSRLVLPAGLRVHCPVQSWACPPAPPSLPPSCTLTQQEPGASSV